LFKVKEVIFLVPEIINFDISEYSIASYIVNYFKVDGISQAECHSSISFIQFKTWSEATSENETIILLEFKMEVNIYVGTPLSLQSYFN
jgi:hypothetical protein